MSNVFTSFIQSIRCQQQKLSFKLNSLFMHYQSTQNPYEEVKKWLSSKCCHFVQKLFSPTVLNSFMQMSNVSTLCVQRIRCQQQKLCYKLNSPCMHYMKLQNPYEEEKFKVQNAVILSKKYFLGIKFLHAHLQCLSIVYTRY